VSLARTTRPVWACSALSQTGRHADRVRRDAPLYGYFKGQATYGKRRHLSDEGRIGKQYTSGHERKQQQYDHSGAIARLQDDLRALENKERAAVEGELAALSAGRNATIYRKVLAKIDQELNQLAARIVDLQERQQERPKEDPKGQSEVIAEALRKLEAVLTADEITVAEKNALLHQVVDFIVPHEDRIEVTLKPWKPGVLLC
jgi:multidrug efflux pump subunit AcrA (membrane-fusion protein)